MKKGKRKQPRIPGDAVTSVDSSVEKGTLLANKDQEIQIDLEEFRLEYSLQTSMEKHEENQEVIRFTLQEAQNNANKKQQHEKIQRATRDMTTTSFIPDNETETINAKCPMGHLDMKGRTSVLQSEASTNVDELEQLCGKLDTAADTELERMKWDFLLAKQKYEHEENEKQRLHEEKMEKIRQQKRSFSQGSQDLLRPLNHYDLFLYCFAIIHLIYSTKELVFYIFQNHYLFCFAIVFLYILKKIFQDCKNKNNSF